MKNIARPGADSDKMFVLANKMPDNWAHLLDIWNAKLQPRDDAERQIVTQAAFALWPRAAALDR